MKTTQIRAILIFSLLATPFLVCSQTKGYLPLEVGNAWYFNGWSIPQLEVVGDTTIGGRSYKSVFSRATPFYYLATLHFRQDSSKVYRYETELGADRLWYDFAASAWDTLQDFGGGWVLECMENQLVRYAGKMRREWSFSTRGNCADCISGEVIVDSIGWRECGGANFDLQLSKAVLSGKTIITNVPGPQYAGPTAFNVAVYPNPFNSMATLTYTVPWQGPVRISLFTILGELVSSTVIQLSTPGRYAYAIDGSKLASGLYICRVAFGQLIAVKPVMLLK